MNTITEVAFLINGVEKLCNRALKKRYGIGTVTLFVMYIYLERCVGVWNRFL